MMLFKPDNETPLAIFSECRRYRYTLRRIARVHGGEGRVNFIMLNPSTADETHNDPTIRRCITFARAWGFDDLVVTNIFALRSTDPTALRAVEDPIGPRNDEWLINVVDGAQLVVCAWGHHGALCRRGEQVAQKLRRVGVKLNALKLSKCGRFPAHPLYLPNGLKPELWT